MTGTTAKPNPDDFNLDETISWRDHPAEFDLEEYGFEDDIYPDDFIHGEVTIALTNYDSVPGSTGYLRMRTENGRTWLRFVYDGESYPGEWGDYSVDMGPAVDDEITASELTQLMDRFTAEPNVTEGFVQIDLAGRGATSREERAEILKFLMEIETISDVATAWYTAVADYWVATGELVYLETAMNDQRTESGR